MPSGRFCLFLKASNELLDLKFIVPTPSIDFGLDFPKKGSDLDLELTHQLLLLLLKKSHQLPDLHKLTLGLMRTRRRRRLLVLVFFKTVNTFQLFRRKAVVGERLVRM